ncbi:helix-hairpin-helix domain-containing protein [candidate division WOR-3 bacterium]|nr:helix-hairpin-helix domain-containing protein [candidate division WOR-3 bacterium]MCK4528188.1 helix-hairpin-helix domain-containing protein [candidate division WOR-3 bacterium]
MLLPGIGEVYAERIIEFRKENNGFRVKRDLLKVKGIGGQKLKRMNDMITIGGKDDDK